MSGLLVEHLETIERNSKNLERERRVIGSIFFILLIVLCISMYMLGMFKPFSLLTYSGKTLTLTFTALILSISALEVNFLNSRTISDINLFHYYEENNIRQKEEHLKHIQEQIKLFYLPLSVLLTITENPEKIQNRSQKIAEINCNKHLAEPRVRVVFESYIKGKKEQKMSELVFRDIENLQKKYIEIKNELQKE